MFVGVVVNAAVKTLVSEITRDGYRFVKSRIKKYREDSDKQLSLDLGV